MNPLHDTIFNFLRTLDSFVWGPPLLILLVGTGLYLTIRLGFIQIRYLPLALQYVFGGKKDPDSRGEGDVSSFAALCTALSATIVLSIHQNMSLLAQCFVPCSSTQNHSFKQDSLKCTQHQICSCQ